MRFKAYALLFAVSWLLLGCSPLAPREEYTNFVVLSPIPNVLNSVSSIKRQTVIGLGPIDFPRYLKRLDVVTRVDANSLEVSPVNRWGEPLDTNFERVLAENLAQLLNTDRIELYPWSRKTEIDYQIVITVQQFETTTAGQSQLSVRWIIKDGSSGKDLFSSQTDTSTPSGTGSAAAAASLSSDLADLSREVADEVTKLSQRRLAKTSIGPT